MPHIVIVGDRESGKTTFLTLLYAAQVKSGSDRADSFRFHAAFDSMDEISGAFQQLMSGSFPDAFAKEGIRGTTFQVSNRKSGLGIVSRLRSRGSTPGASISLHFILVRNLDEEMARFRRGSSLSNAALREVLESDAIAILVDSTKLTAQGEEPSLGRNAPYDEAVESMLTILDRPRSQDSRKRVHPIVILSKFDAVDPKVLRAAGLEATPPDIRKSGARTAYAEALLEPNLPKTTAKLRTREPRGKALTLPAYFFSSVRTEQQPPDSRPRVRLRRVGGAGWEPDYASDEYLALLESFWKIAADARE
jgi:hypothetical protein